MRNSFLKKVSCTNDDNNVFRRFSDVIVDIKRGLAIGGQCCNLHQLLGE